MAGLAKTRRRCRALRWEAVANGQPAVTVNTSGPPERVVQAQTQRADQVRWEDRTNRRATTQSPICLKVTLNPRERGHFDALHNAAVMGAVGEPA
jgi:hypothetical protein